jgi:iron(III) transport system permease protein
MPLKPEKHVKRRAPSGLRHPQSLGAGKVLAWASLLLVALPVLFLLALALGWTGLGRATVQVVSTSSSLGHLWDTVLGLYLLNTVGLLFMTVTVAGVLGVGMGWLMAGYRFRFHAAFDWILVLPLAMPAYVMAYAYTDALDSYGLVQQSLRAWTGWQHGQYSFPNVRSLWGAGLFIGLALYPYVFLLARRAFAERSASLEESARALGLSPLRVWWKVIWPMARPAVAAGLVLVMMETLADFGVTSYFGVDTLTVAIYKAWQNMGDRLTGARLAVMLLLASGILVFIERKLRGRMQFFSRNPKIAQPRWLAGGRACVAIFACVAVPLLAFGLPVVFLILKWVKDDAGFDARLFLWLWHSFHLSMVAAIITVTLTLGAAYALRLYPRRPLHVAVGLANAGYALPGLVIAVGLLAALSTLDNGLAWIFGSNGLLLGSSAGVIYAYMVRFYSVSFQTLEAGLKQISPVLDQAARSLGRKPVEVLREVHFPIMRRSLLTALLLVMVDSLKELPATLILRPFNTDTLAVVVYQFASDERLADAALPSLMIVAIGLLPVLLMTKMTRTT